MPRKKRDFPFRKSNGNVIWTLSDGEEIALSWEEFKKMVESRKMIALPKEEFEQYYKKMKLPKVVREYHRNAKRMNKLKEE